MLHLKVIGAAGGTREEEIELKSEVSVSELLQRVKEDLKPVDVLWDNILIFVNGRSIQRAEANNTKIRDGELVVALNFIAAGG